MDVHVARLSVTAFVKYISRDIAKQCLCMASNTGAQAQALYAGPIARQYIRA